MKTWKVAAFCLVVAIASGLAIFGITPIQTDSPATQGAPSVPVHVKITLSPAPPLWHTADLRLLVLSDLDASNLSANLTVPVQGFVVISGELNWRGNLSKGEMVELRCTIEAVRIGDWLLVGAAGYYLRDANGNAYGWYGDRARLTVMVSENSASIIDDRDGSQLSVRQPMQLSIIPRRIYPPGSCDSDSCFSGNM